MRRYELMLVFRPDAPDERLAAIIDRTTRQITADGGQIVKVAPWGRRRLAYQIDRHREGSYQIILFEAPPEEFLKSDNPAVRQFVQGSAKGPLTVEFQREENTAVSEVP